MLSQAAAKAEQAIGHGDNAVTEQDVTNPARNREKYGDPTETMKALAWQGKNSVEVSKYTPPHLVSPLDGANRKHRQLNAQSRRSSRIGM